MSEQQANQDDQKICEEGVAAHEKCRASLDDVLAILKEHGEILEDHGQRLTSQGAAISSIETHLALIQKAQVQQNQIASSLHAMTSQVQEHLGTLACMPGNSNNGNGPPPNLRKRKRRSPSVEISDLRPSAAELLALEAKEEKEG